MALSLMIHKGSKIFSYTEIFSRIISYLIRRKKNHKKISSKWKANVIEYQNGVMAGHMMMICRFFSKFLTTHDVIWRKYLLDIAMQLVNYGLKMISSISDTYLDG